MRLLRQRRQLRQKATNYSGGCATHPIVRVDADLGGLRTLEPLPQLTFTKSPLPADFEAWNFLTFCPKAKRASCNPQPFRDARGVRAVPDLMTVSDRKSTRLNSSHLVIS